MSETIPPGRPVVLLTRPRAQSEAFAHRLGQALDGRADIAIAPLIEIVPTGTEVPLSGATHLLVTSARALPALDAAKAPATPPVLCVGTRTAEAARQRGLSVLAEAPTATALADVALTVLPTGAHVVYLRGRHVAVDIANRLERAGHTVTEAIVYDQRALPLSEEAMGFLRSGRPIIAPLFSARSARLFRAALATAPPAGSLCPVAISPAVAEAFGPAGGAVTIAEAPTADAVLKAILAIV